MRQFATDRHASNTSPQKKKGDPKAALSSFPCHFNLVEAAAHPTCEGCQYDQCQRRWCWNLAATRGARCRAGGAGCRAARRHTRRGQAARRGHTRRRGIAAGCQTARRRGACRRGITARGARRGGVTARSIARGRGHPARCDTTRCDATRCPAAARRRARAGRRAGARRRGEAAGGNTRRCQTTGGQAT